MPEENMFPPNADCPGAGADSNSPDRRGEEFVEIPVRGMVFLFPEGRALLDREFPVNDPGGKRHTVGFPALPAISAGKETVNINRADLPYGFSWNYGCHRYHLKCVLPPSRKSGRRLRVRAS